MLADPLRQPLFGAGCPEHVEHLTAFTAEGFGGPDRFTRVWGRGPAEPPGSPGRGRGGAD